MTYTCPVCFYEMSEPPNHYNICDQCGTEFENDDDAVYGLTHEALRAKWIAAGRPFFFTQEKAASE